MPRSRQHIPTEARRHISYGVKLTDSEFAGLIPFFDTFPYAAQSASLRWLLEHDDVKRLIKDRVNAATIQS